MHTKLINFSSVPEHSAPASGAKSQKRSMRGWALAGMIGVLSFGLGGCVSDDYLGVSTYPSYGAYYDDYGYSGIPYAGYGGIYTRSILVGNRRYSGGYGRHHFIGNRGGHRSGFSGSHRGMRGHGGMRGGGHR